jgi:hypothetical protein
MRRAQLPLRGTALRPGAGAVGTCGWERDGRARDSESKSKEKRSEGCARGPLPLAGGSGSSRKKPRCSSKRPWLFLQEAALFFEEVPALLARSRVVLRRGPGSSCKKARCSSKRSRLFLFFEEDPALFARSRVLLARRRVLLRRVPGSSYNNPCSSFEEARLALQEAATPLAGGPASPCTRLGSHS